MKPEKARLRRLRLVARIREVEHSSATSEAASAAAAEERSRQLAARAAKLSADSPHSSQACSGFELAAQRIVASNLRNAVHETQEAVRNASRLAQDRMMEAHRARMKRDKVLEEKGRLVREIEEQQQAQTSQ